MGKIINYSRMQNNSLIMIQDHESYNIERKILEGKLFELDT